MLFFSLFSHPTVAGGGRGDRIRAFYTSNASLSLYRVKGVVRCEKTVAISRAPAAGSPQDGSRRCSTTPGVWWRPARQNTGFKNLSLVALRVRELVLRSWDLRGRLQTHEFYSGLVMMSGSVFLSTTAYQRKQDIPPLPAFPLLCHCLQHSCPSYSTASTPTRFIIPLLSHTCNPSVHSTRQPIIKKKWICFVESTNVDLGRGAEPLPTVSEWTSAQPTLIRASSALPTTFHILAHNH